METVHIQLISIQLLAAVEELVAGLNVTGHMVHQNAYLMVDLILNGLKLTIVEDMKLFTSFLLSEVIYCN